MPYLIPPIHSAFQPDCPGEVRVRRERIREVERLEAGGVNGSLRVHAKDHHVEENLHDGLSLGVPSRRAKRHQEFTILEYHARIGSDARALAWLERIWVLRVQVELHHAVAQGKAGARYHGSSRSGSRLYPDVATVLCEGFSTKRPRSF